MSREHFVVVDMFAPDPARGPRPDGSYLARSEPLGYAVVLVEPAGKRAGHALVQPPIFPSRAAAEEAAWRLRQEAAGRAARIRRHQGARRSARATPRGSSPPDGDPL